MWSGTIRPYPVGDLLSGCEPGSVRPERVSGETAPTTPAILMGWTWWWGERPPAAPRRCGRSPHHHVQPIRIAGVVGAVSPLTRSGRTEPGSHPDNRSPTG